MTMNWHQLLCAERLGNRPMKDEEGRSPFHSDHDKIIFSGAFRRLARKTQVHPLATNDHIHNRMTHSLEVACVGRTLGIRVGAALKNAGDLPEQIVPTDIGDIVQASCLAHDIGNPPFGHTGEEAIRNWFQKEGASYLEALKPAEQTDIRVFEGNAQGLRVLTTSEYHQYQEGMRLTYATLASSIKYPWCSEATVNQQRPKHNKYGIFQTELDYFHEIARKTGLIAKGEDWYCRHPLVYLMEAADDFCYGIIDLEDGLEMGIISWDEIYGILRSVIDPPQIPELEKSLTKVSDGRKPAILRGKAIDAFITAGTEAFINHQHAFLNGSVEGDLISLCDTKVMTAVQAAKDLAKRKIFNQSKRVELEIGAYSTIGTLLSTICSAVAASLGDQHKMTYKDNRVMSLMGDSNFHPSVFRKQANYQYQAIMAVIDYISGMTDNYATNLAKQFNGMGDSRY
jgi:dGTPase